MTIRHMNYLSLTPGRRQKAASIHLQRLREELQMNPALTQPQKDAINARIADLNSWIAGTVSGVTAYPNGYIDAT